MNSVTDPRRLDIAAFAADAGRLEGEWPLSDLTRLHEDEPAALANREAAVAWRAAGSLRTVAVGAPEVWLRVHARADVARICQRCLQPVMLALVVERDLRFVHGEAAAAALDADSEDDVLALPHRLDLRELVEDELLLALPLVPRHDACPEPLTMATPPGDAFAEEAHPFAALAALTRARRPS